MSMSCANDGERTVQLARTPRNPEEGRGAETSPETPKRVARVNPSQFVLDSRPPDGHVESLTHGAGGRRRGAATGDGIYGQRRPCEGSGDEGCSVAGYSEDGALAALLLVVLGHPSGRQRRR